MEYLVYASIIIGVVFVVAACTMYIKRQETSKTKLIDKGYEYIFSGGSDSFIAFNIEEGKIRFGKLAKYQFVERPVSYITNHEWKWVEEGGEKKSNKFLFYLSDTEYYMHEVFYHSEYRRAEIEWAKLQAVINECVSSQYIQVEKMDRNNEYDFFISHASEDKEDFVRPLAEALSNRGLKIWYDEMSLEIGDSLRKKIDQGLGQSRFGIVVLSKNFFLKPWPQYELDALVNKSIIGEKVILPVWHGVDHQDVSRYSHNLADKVAFSTSNLNVAHMADEFFRLVQRTL